MQRAELHVRGLNANVVNAFREYVLKKYGKLHTVFGLEVEKALSEYLKRQEEMDANDD
jgi:ribosome-associated translation inhibitor RaiA